MDDEMRLFEHLHSQDSPVTISICVICGRLVGAGKDITKIAIAERAHRACVKASKLNSTSTPS
jgi:hypothetical protein